MSDLQCSHMGTTSHPCANSTLPPGQVHPPETWLLASPCPSPTTPHPCSRLTLLLCLDPTTLAWTKMHSLLGFFLRSIARLWPGTTLSAQLNAHPGPEGHVQQQGSGVEPVSLFSTRVMFLLAPQPRCSVLSTSPQHLLGLLFQHHFSGSS